jgi:hypothetical protein
LPESDRGSNGVSAATVAGYLYNQVGEGLIRRSDILFSIDPRTRAGIESLISELGTSNWVRVTIAAKRLADSINLDDLYIYLQLRDARVAFGDMYEFLRSIELALHALVRTMLEAEYGSEW